MRTGICKRIIALAVCVLLTAAVGYAGAGSASAASAVEIDAHIDSILSGKIKRAGAANVQQLLNGELAAGAGSVSEWYILALRQYEKGFDFSEYSSALERYVSANETANASTRLRYAISFAALGTNYEYISSTLNNSIGKLGIMSWVFGLHLMNNGYGCSSVTQSEAVNKLLSFQLADGGFALSGAVADVDVTAMTVQALAKHYSNAAVKSAVDKAVALLSQLQQADGGFVSYGVANPESCAQVITALASLGIDCTLDSRFIKNENTVLDAMMKYKLASGGFCHTAGGEMNENATVQALYSLVALWRNAKGMTPFYTFAKKASPQATTAAPTAAPAVVIRPQGTTIKAAHTTTEAQATTRVSRRRVTTTAPATTTVPDKQVTTKRPSQTTVASTRTATTAAPPAAATTVHGIEAVTVTQVLTTALQEEQTVETREEEAESPTDAVASGKETNYKSIVYAVIVIAALAGSAALLITGKTSLKNFIAVILIAAALCGVNAFVDIQSRGSFYSDADLTQPSANSVTVTLSIRCNSVAGLSDKEYIPADGIILDESEFTVSEGSSVYDVLVLAARQNEISVENSAATESAAYIAGINYIYEFDFGDISGWVYKVNGETPSSGCGTYAVKNGDKIEWLYSLNLGEDVR